MLKYLRFTFLLCFLTFTCFRVTGQNFYTALGGDWNAASTWGGPPPLPPLTADSIFIRHPVTFDSALHITANYLHIGNYYGSLTSFYDPTNITPNPNDSLLINVSDLLIDDCGGLTYEFKGYIGTYYINIKSTNRFRNYGFMGGVHADFSYFENHGTIQMDSIYFEGTLASINMGEINFEQLTYSGALINELHIVSPWGTMITGDTLINNGITVLENWVHNTYCTGDSTGQVCVSDDFINTGLITGYLDICDLTPGSAGDILTGSIDSTIISCAGDSCLYLGVHILKPETFSFSLFPSPAKEDITLRLSSVQSGEVAVISTDGRVMKQQTFNVARELPMDISKMAAGIYLVRVTTRNGTAVKKLIVE